jgi:hypothetical protein
MGKEHRELVTQTFRGGRFEDHGLDLDVLPELVTYKGLLVETAKELWRRKNPDRERLPGGFEDSLVLKVYEIGEGSVKVPICREYERAEQGSLWPESDELDEAVDLTTRMLDAVGKDMPFPDDYPIGLLGQFKEYGKSLRDDEVIEHRRPGSTAVARYTPAVRARLAECAERFYEDAVDVVGTVTMARVSPPLMTITMDDGSKVDALFAPDQEETITTALQKHATAKVRIRGRGEFANGTLRKIVAVDSAELLPEGEIPFDYASPPIWEVFEQIMRDVPEEELCKLPADAAEQHDHYIYGIPRREP